MPEKVNHNSATAVVGEYGVEQIKVLEDLEAVRMRPGMYIGGTGQDGLMHLIWEIVDNAIDEHLAGSCTEIKVTVHEDNRVTVEDNGRGVPVEIHPEAGINTLELVFTKLHAGGKFDTGGYKVSGGLHGVGASVVNALSESLEVEVQRNGQRYYQKFSRGTPVCELTPNGPAQGTGTTVTFLPDRQIFGEIKYDFARLSHRLKELAYLNPGLTIYLDNRAAGIQRRYQFEGGIAAYVKELNEGRTPLHPDVISLRDESESLSVEVAMQFTDEYDENIHSFANIINTKEGGTHLMGFKTALTRVFN
ncbi:MAG: ATP-binding protein, partial [Candidatus Bipolaricaulota bacterium]|nr:ATP-binding protein [Candidatus Bipolaricaulota bacterium]